MHRSLKIFLILSLGITLGAGCASTTRTVRTETDIYRPGEPTVAERETTVTTKSEEGSSGGILSGTVNAAGEVLALPFRAVGGLIRVIF